LFTEGSLELRGAPICSRLDGFFRRGRPPPTLGASTAPTVFLSLGRGAAGQPASDGRYAAGMSEYSLDRLVNQFAGVLTAMTQSESLLRDQVRRVRLGAQGQPGAAGGATFSSAPFPTGASTPEPPAAPEGTLQTAQGGEPTRARMSAPAMSNRPEHSETKAASPVAGHRNYDYFSELDEKLTGLRERYLE
jgi:hypothetical protein